MQKISSKYFPDLRRIRQKNDSYCGPAVLQMLASFIGISFKQDKLVELTHMEKKIVKFGMNIFDLRKAVNAATSNAIFWYKEKSTIGDIDKLINEYKYPVGVEWQGVFREDTDKNFPDDGHYSVVTYLNKAKNKIMIADPFRDFVKKDRIFKIDFFERRWWDYNDIKDKKTRKMKHVKDTHMIFLVTRPDEAFPEELGMKKI